MSVFLTDQETDTLNTDFREMSHINSGLMRSTNRDITINLYGEVWWCTTNIMHTQIFTIVMAL
jgi:hypothetical protein